MVIEYKNELEIKNKKMKTLKYKVETPWNWLILSTFSGGLDKNICGWFWKLLATIVLFPFMLHLHIFNLGNFLGTKNKQYWWRDGNDEINFYHGFPIMIVTIVLGLLCSVKLFLTGNIGLAILSYILGPWILIGGFLLFLLAGDFLWSQAKKLKIFPHKKPKKQREWALVEGFKSWKDKKCTKIEWNYKKST